MSGVPSTPSPPRDAQRNWESEHRASLLGNLPAYGKATYGVPPRDSTEWQQKSVLFQYMKNRILKSYGNVEFFPGPNGAGYVKGHAHIDGVRREAILDPGDNLYIKGLTDDAKYAKVLHAADAAVSAVETQAAAAVEAQAAVEAHLVEDITSRMYELYELCLHQVPENWEEVRAWNAWNVRGYAEKTKKVLYHKCDPQTKGSEFPYDITDNYINVSPQIWVSRTIGFEDSKTTYDISIGIGKVWNQHAHVVEDYAVYAGFKVTGHNWNRAQIVNADKYKEIEKLIDADTDFDAESIAPDVPDKLSRLVGDGLHSVRRGS